MEQFPITIPRVPYAKLLCEKWDLQKLMELKKKGPITVFIDSQMTQCEIKPLPSNSSNDDNNSDSEHNDSDEDELLTCTNKEIVPFDTCGTIAGVNLGEAGIDWVKEGKRAMQKSPRRYKGKDKVDPRTIDVKKFNEVKEILQNEIGVLKEEKKVRKKEMEELVKKNLSLLEKEKEFKCINEQKDIRISLLEQEVKDLKFKLTTRSNESVALRKRVNIKDSKVQVLARKTAKLSAEKEELLEAKERLIQENTELEVQKVTQEAYSSKGFVYKSGRWQESPTSEKMYVRKSGKWLDSRVLVSKKLDYNLKSGEKKVAKKSFLQECTSSKDDEDQIVHDDTVAQATKGLISLKQKEKIDVEILEKRVRIPAFRRSSFVWGSEAEESPANEISEPTCMVMPLNAVFAEDNDFERPPAKRRVTKKVSQQIDKFTKMKHAKHLNTEYREKLLLIESVLHEGCVVAKFPSNRGAVVLLDDLYSVLDGGVMSGRLINAHAQILLEKYSHCEEIPVTIFDSNIWKYVKSKEMPDDPEEDNRIKDVDEAVLNAPSTGLYLFPVTTNRNVDYKTNPNHWILLAHDLKQPIWQLYNSMQPKGKNSYNPYLKDAEMFKLHIEDLLRMKWRLYHFDIPDALAADRAEDHCFPITEPRCPQQLPGSLDCGTYVCYAMEQLLKGGEVPKRLKVDEMLKYKAYMVQNMVDRFDMARLDKVAKRPRFRLDVD